MNEFNEWIFPMNEFCSQKSVQLKKVPSLRCFTFLSFLFRLFKLAFKNLLKNYLKFILASSEHTINSRLFLLSILCGRGVGSRLHNFWFRMPWHLKCPTEARSDKQKRLTVIDFFTFSFKKKKEKEKYFYLI